VFFMLYVFECGFEVDLGYLLISVGIRVYLNIISNIRLFGYLNIEYSII